MRTLNRMSLLLSLAVFAAALGGASPRAEPLRVERGPVALPLTGLALELPARAGRSYAVSGSWRMAADRSAFDARDVIDEHAGEALVAGTWVMVGWFTAGDCLAVVREAALTGGWEAPRVSLWGGTFAARGGVFAFDGPLGERPAIALCAERAPRKSLLVYHFFLARTGAMTQAEMLRALAPRGVPELAYRAWRDAMRPGREADQAQPNAAVPPLHRAEVRDRSDAAAPAPAALTLASTRLTVALPDDGFVWMPHRGAEGVDQLDRLAPALPEVMVEVARVEGIDACAAGFALLDNPVAGVRLDGLPAAWEAGPVLSFGNGDREVTMCAMAPWGALLGGIFIAPPPAGATVDVRPFAPLLDAIAAATGRGPRDSRAPSDRATASAWSAR